MAKTMENVQKALYLKKKCVILIADCQRGNKWTDGYNAVEDSTS